MFSEAKARARRIFLIASMTFNFGFVIEHGAGAWAVHHGLIQGKVVPPAIAFGGYDADKERQIAMLGDALPITAMTPPAAKIEIPVPPHKPQVTK